MPDLNSKERPLVFYVYSTIKITLSYIWFQVVFLYDLNLSLTDEAIKDSQFMDSCLLFLPYLKTISQKPEVEKPVSQTDHCEHKEKVEELTEDKSSEVNVVSEPLLLL